VLRYADQNDSDLSSLHTVICGGTQVPPWLMHAYEEKHAVQLVQGWGMTEILPGATIAHDPVKHGYVTNASPENRNAERWARRATAGRVSPLYEVRVRADNGQVLPSDGSSVGEI